MGGTSFCDVSANVWDADARNQYRCLLPVFSCRREECYGPMNAKCLTIQSCKGFVYLYMVMGKINHWSKSHIFSKTLSYMFGGRGGKKKRGNQGCSRLHWSEVSSCQGSARVSIQWAFGPLSHVTALSLWQASQLRSGVGFQHIHLPTILLCTRVIKSTNTCNHPYIRHDSTNQPISSCDLLWPKPSPPPLHAIGWNG